MITWEQFLDNNKLMTNDGAMCTPEKGFALCMASSSNPAHTQWHYYVSAYIYEVSGGVSLIKYKEHPQPAIILNHDNLSFFRRSTYSKYIPSVVEIVNKYVLEPFDIPVRLATQPYKGDNLFFLYHTKTGKWTYSFTYIHWPGGLSIPIAGTFDARDWQVHRAQTPTKKAPIPECLTVEGTYDPDKAVLDAELAEVSKLFIS